MKKVFLDTNIIIDLIADRKPFSSFALEIFAQVEPGKRTLFTSSLSIATTHYLLKKYMEEAALREVLHQLLHYVHVVPLEEADIKKGLKSKHKDFEDGLQIICAERIHNLHCIVTRNSSVHAR